VRMVLHPGLWRRARRQCGRGRARQGAGRSAGTADRGVAEEPAGHADIEHEPSRRTRTRATSKEPARVAREVPRGGQARAHAEAQGPRQARRAVAGRARRGEVSVTDAYHERITAIREAVASQVAVLSEVAFDLREDGNVGLAADVEKIVSLLEHDSNG